MTSGRPCKIGLYLPMAEHEMEGETPRWTDILAVARRAEELGFDSVFIADHLIYHFEGKDTYGIWEGMSLLAALAAATERVELGTGVICTGFRNPALLAKMAETIDEISGGRLILGIGAGWHDPEYVAFGYPTDHKFSRFQEALQIIHPMLKTGKADFQGEYYAANDADLMPRGPRPNGLPLMIASTGDRMLDLTARYADAWNGWVVRGRNAELLGRLDAACEAIGRDPATLERVGMVMVDHTGAEIDPNARRPPIQGSPEEMAEAFRSLADDGLSHLVVAHEPNNIAGLEALAPVLEILDGGS
ncbi:MAG: LLM class flavin-dependent oxidoreductase [Thermomicrobiales bacterium]